MFRKTHFKSQSTIYLCDTMGSEEDAGLNALDYPYILDGHIPDKFEFPMDARITRDSPGFIQFPTIKEKMHCLCFIMDSRKVDLFLNHVTEKKIAEIKSLASAREIRFVVVLTKIDLFCPEVAKDVKNAYRSRALREVVDKVSAFTGTPISRIFLIKNYSQEGRVNQDVDVLALTALRQMLWFCDDILEDMEDDEGEGPRAHQD